MTVVAPSIQRICIIGAGASGLATARALLAEKCFHKIDILEQRAETGGVWNYTAEVAPTLIPSPSPHIPDKPIQSPAQDGKPVFISAMYDRLETNIPKSLMRFSSLSFKEDLQLFPPHEAVRGYLQEYGRDLEHLITYNVTVRKCRKEENSWKVEMNDTRTSEVVDVHSYDAVVVTSGHYTCPYIPSDIKGIEEWNRQYPRSIIHSKFFRRPETYEGKKVVVVGSAASGLDIASQIVQYALRPVLQSQRSISYLSTGSANGIQEVPEIKAFDAVDRAVHFSDGRVEKNLDAVIFCTGYLHSLPFLSTLNDSPAPLVTTGSRVHNVYQHIFYIADPTLSFVGLPIKVIPFPVAEAQASYISRVYARRLSLPAQSTMKEWEAEQIAEKGENKFHHLNFPQDADYLEFLGRAVDTADGKGGFDPPKWGDRERRTRKRFPLLRKAFIEKKKQGLIVKTIEELGFDAGTGTFKDDSRLENDDFTKEAEEETEKL